MGKLISWIAVFLLLVVVPIGSWVYLNKGLNYRKAALSELLPKDSIDIRLDTLNLFVGKTSLVVLKNNASTTEVIKSLSEQFANTQGFQIVFKDSTDNNLFTPAGYLNGYLAKDINNSFLLIDEKMKVRNVYKDDVASVKKMVEHIAIVIPRPKEADIEQKK